jgi:formylglycine-generating enzyme required for sulfatase activity
MLSPQTILNDRYRIERMLGQGGMGAVYLAIDQKFGSTVALKETLMSGDVLERAFEREARLLNKMRHAALPVVMDYFAEGDGHFLVMQFIPGEDLAALLSERGGPFPVAEVLGWADALLDALDYLHSQDPPVVHRDIKPQNMKLTPRGEIILLDFGLAKGASADPSQTTGTGSVMAYTAHYAPFEQIRGAGTDARSDLYSLGATLYTLVTGKIPADALTRAEASMSRQPDPLVRADVANPFVPAPVANVLERAMAMDRNERFPRATDMRAALRSAARGVGVEPGSASTLVASSQAPSTSETPAGAETVAAGVAPRPGTEAAPGGATTQPVTNARAHSPLLWPTIALVAVIAIAAAALLPPYLRPADAPPPAAEPPPGDVAMITTAPGMSTFTFETASLTPAGVVTGRKQEFGQAFQADVADGVAIDLVRIPAGSFQMGSPETEANRFGDEGPAYTVTVPEFYLGRYEVTQAQWRAVAALPKVKFDLPADPSAFKGDTLPVENVTWDEAVEFCDRLRMKLRRNFRLPSEQEWEYACRAGTTTPFAFGATLSPEVANYNAATPYGSGPKGASATATIPVGSLKLANAFGLLDMHGNVWEWCFGIYHESYVGAPTDGSAWTTDGDPRSRNCRGGAWNTLAPDCRSANRYGRDMYETPRGVGFRVAMRVEKD